MNSQLVSGAEGILWLHGFAAKFGLTLGLFLVGIALEWSGFRTIAGQTLNNQR